MMTVSGETAEVSMASDRASDLASEDAERGAQLPNLEDARMNSSSGLVTGSGKRRKWYIIGAVVLCLILVVVLSVVLATRDNGGSSSSKAQAGPTPSGPSPSGPTPSGPSPSGPTPSGPSPSPPSGSPPSDSVTATRMQDVESFILEERISSEVDVFNPDSAQSKAIKFMAQDDELQLEVPDSKDDAGALEFVQRYALAVMYYAFTGDLWVSDLRFLSADPVCTGWFQQVMLTPFFAERFGAGCDADDQVIYLHIPQWNVSGTIPPEIGQLSKLQYLDLQRNIFLTGPLPDTMAALTDLDYFMMDYSSITGRIPDWIGSLPKLEVMSFSNNFFEGPFPTSLENLSTLKILALDDNLMSGEVTPLRELTNLEGLYLEDNAFEDDLADLDFSGLTKLIRIDISSNKFYGNIPDYWLSLEDLIVLDLHSNDFSGPIPDIPEENNSLEYLFLYNNSLSSSIPSTISNLKSLSHLDLSLNQLTGTITTHIGNMTMLTYLFLAHNPFTPGPIPLELFNLYNLWDLSLKDTRRTGTIPTEIGNLDVLYLLDLDGNDLIGAIPSEIGKLSWVQMVLLNRNLLDGPIPIEMGELSRLVFFVVDENDITGTTDLVCQNWTNLEVMIADCVTEVDCECCTLCCDDNEPCNDEPLFAAYDPIWERRYGRKDYDFGTNLTFG